MGSSKVFAWLHKEKEFLKEGVNKLLCKRERCGSLVEIFKYMTRFITIILVIKDKINNSLKSLWMNCLGHSHSRHDVAQ
jgi:hypothetical protein